MARLILAFALVAAVLVAASPASARRAPSRSENTAIRAGIAAYAAQADSRAGSDARVKRIFVSTVDARYALARFVSDGGAATAILHRRNGAWKVVRFGTGGFVRFGLPKRVVEDLLGGHLCSCH